MFIKINSKSVFRKMGNNVKELTSFSANKLIYNRGHKCWHYLQILLIMTSLPTPFNVEVPRELLSYVGAPQTSTLKGERREIISYTS